MASGASAPTLHRARIGARESLVEVELRVGGIGVEVEIDGVRGVATLIGLAALATMIVRELRTPADQRRGHGRLAGIVLYDLRLPLPERFRRALWDRGDPGVVVGTPSGVGWTANFGRLTARANRCRDARPDALDLEFAPAR